MQIGFTMGGTLSGCFSCGVGGWRSTAPRLSSVTHSLPRPKKDPKTESPGVMSPIQQVPSSAAWPVLGASTVGRSPLGSASSTVPDSRHRWSHSRTSQPQTQVSDAPAPLAQCVGSTLVPHMLIRIADTHVLHPFFHHRLDIGALWLTSIAHAFNAFNYRIAVLRDGVKLAACVGRSRRRPDKF